MFKTVFMVFAVVVFAIGKIVADDSYADTKVTIKVVGEDGMPIVNAKVGIGFFGRNGSNPKGVSGNSGLFTAQSQSQYGEFAYSVNDNGYYETTGRERIKNAKGEYEQKDGKWQPWNPTYEVVLKKIINPVPMFAKICNLGLPKIGEKIGFDLEKADWVAPYGKGVTSDFIFFGELDQRGPSDFDYKLTVSFSNPGDGIISFEAPYQYGSALKSSQQAPANGYKPEWIQTKSRRPGEYFKGNFDREKRNYYFRVRSRLDEQGNVTQAMYGKIYGDFMQFVYYVNPDHTRNIEFDPKKNLMIKPEDNPYDTKYSGCRNLPP